MDPKMEVLIKWCGSQEKAADVLGITQSTVSRILRQKINPHGSTNKLLNFIVEGNRVKEIESLLI